MVVVVARVRVYGSVVGNEKEKEAKRKQAFMDEATNGSDSGGPFWSQ
jgi:hypothetical protein